jgi:hypothetical protein
VQELSQRIRELERALRDQRSQDDEERLLDKIRVATTAQRVLAGC